MPAKELTQTSEQPSRDDHPMSKGRARFDFLVTTVVQTRGKRALSARSCTL